MRKKSQQNVTEPLPEINFTYRHEEVIEVHIEMLRPYPDHPFKPLPPEKLEALAERIRLNDLQQPVIL